MWSEVEGRKKGMGYCRRKYVVGEAGVEILWPL